jgi:hypothetical protein
MEKWQQYALTQWTLIAEQARSNTRLRICLWLILFIIIVYPLFILSDYNAGFKEDIVRELEREARISRTAGEVQWLQRQEDVATLNNSLQSLIWFAPTLGVAKATLNQTLSEWAAKAKLDRLRIRLEDPLAVDGYDNLYRVAGQINAEFNAERSMRFLRELESSRTKVVIEQMDIRNDKRGTYRLQISAYFSISNQDSQ